MRPHSKQLESLAFGQPGGMKQARKVILCISDLMPAAEGSTTLELNTDTPFTLSAKVECCKLTTGVCDIPPASNEVRIPGIAGIAGVFGFVWVSQAGWSNSVNQIPTESLCKGVWKGKERASAFLRGSKG